MDRFDELLFETIDHTIRLVFGESAYKLIYGFVERQALLKRKQVDKKIEVLYSYLEKLIGPEGAQVIQVTSLKRLCLKLRREYEEIERCVSLLDELYEIRFELLASSLKEERSLCN